MNLRCFGVFINKEFRIPQKDFDFVVEFRLSILYSLVRYPVGEITVYTADET